MRYLVVLLALAVAGCSPSTAPDTLVGTAWDLSTVNGQAVPAPNDQGIIILWAEIEFRSDSTFAMRGAFEGQPTTSWTLGGYTRLGSQVTFVWPAAPELPQTATLDGAELRFPTAVYVRRE
jgi:hypothetical protein